MLQLGSFYHLFLLKPKLATTIIATTVWIHLETDEVLLNIPSQVHFNGFLHACEDPILSVWVAHLDLLEVILDILVLIYLTEINPYLRILFIYVSWDRVM